MIVSALEALLSATLLMLLVLAVRRPVSELFGAEWAYALWLLPVLVPILPSLPALEPAPAFTVLVPGIEVGIVPAEGAAGGAEWLLLLLALWVGGAAFFAVWQQSTYSAFMLHLGPQGRTAVPSDFGGIRVIESDAVDGPVAVGVFRRRIVVPTDFATRYSAAEQRLALEHELIHHRRFDLVWNWVALGMLAVNWFNPVAHLAFRAFRSDQELACDAAVTRRSPASRHDYALALVKSASRPGLIAVCPLNRAEFLKRRLKMMKQHRASWGRTLGGVSSLALAGAAGLLFATPGFAEAEPRQLVVAKQSAGPVISPAELAELRVKCGRDEAPAPGGASIVCSPEEARDPEVRAIMNGAMARVERKVEEATRRAIDASKIRERVARAVEPLPVKHDEHARLAVEAARKAQEAGHEFDRAAMSAKLADSLARVRAQLARLDHGKRDREIGTVLTIERKRFATVDVEKIHADALRGAHLALARVPHLSAEDMTEIQREVDEARREAQREAAEERREAAREQREFAREMRELQRELQRELRHLPRPQVRVTPAVSVTIVTPLAPDAPPAPITR